MRNIIYDRKGVSNILGYLFSFGVASMLMISAVIITTNILDKRTAAVAGMQAQSIANKVADAIVEAVAVLQSPSNVGYKKTLDMPMDLAGRDYYVDVTDKMIYVNTTDGLVSKSCPTYTAEDLKIGVGGGRTYCGGIGKINVSVDKSDTLYKLDFGTGNITRHSPVASGYYFVSNETKLNPNNPHFSPRNPSWWNISYANRIPILINNTSPNDLVNVPVKIILNTSNFDYSRANVIFTNSSSDITSDLVFNDPSDNIVAKIEITPTAWEPSWFYTYYYPTENTVTVRIKEISGGYDPSYINKDTIRLNGNIRPKIWSVSNGVGTAKFDGKEAMESLENGRHFLKKPSYTVTVSGLLRNGVEFHGLGYILIKNVVYVREGQSIQNKIDSLPSGGTVFVYNGTYLENGLFINKPLNLIGESRDGTVFNVNEFDEPAFKIANKDNVNIDSFWIYPKISYEWPLVDGIDVYRCNRINITNCRINGTAKGIKIASESSDVSISNCLTYEMSEYPGAEHGNGIAIWDSNYVRITNCVTYHLNTTVGDGFDIRLSNYVDVIKCISHDHYGDGANGVKIIGSNYCNVIDGRFYNLTGLSSSGVEICGESSITVVNPSKYNVVRGCVIYGNNASSSEALTEGRGIHIVDPGCDDNIIENCNIYKNRIGIKCAEFFVFSDLSEGFFNAPWSRIRISNCTVHDNENIGIAFHHKLGNIISNCSIYNNGREPNISAFNNSCGIHLLASGFNIIRNCNIYNNGLNEYGGNGILMIFAGFNTIENCNIYGNIKGIGYQGDKRGDGIRCQSVVAVTGSGFNTIKYCNIFDNGDDGIQIGIQGGFVNWGNRIYYCNFYNNKGVGVRIHLFETAHQIKWCNFENNTDCGYEAGLDVWRFNYYDDYSGTGWYLIPIATWDSSPVSTRYNYPAFFQVNPSYTESFYKTKTIKKAMQNMDIMGVGGTVKVYPGTYSENIAINQAKVKLIGEGSVTVIGSGQNPDWTGNVIQVNNYSVSIEGLNLKDGDKGIYYTYNLPSVGTPYIIKNCKIESTGQEGIYLGGNINNYCIINNCNISGNKYGIYVGTKNNKITDCIIKNNNVAGDSYGIKIQNGDSNIFTNCTLSNNKIGFQIASGSDNNIINNSRILVHSDCGIKITSSSNNNKITNCSISNNNNGNGIHIYSSNYNIIRDTTISGSTNGVEIENSPTKNNISYCYIYDNGCGIYIHDNFEDMAVLYKNSITNCSIYDNNNYGVWTHTTSNYNKIYHNIFKNTNNAKNDGSANNIWDNGYPLGGNLWSDYDEEIEGAKDYCKGQVTPQTVLGSDGIADNPYTKNGVNDRYPFCRKNPTIPYFIDYWNPYGDSVILVNMSIGASSSKCINLYYGYNGPLDKIHNHTMKEISLVFDDFNPTTIFVTPLDYPWQIIGSYSFEDGCINLSDGTYIIAKNYFIPSIGDPPKNTLYPTTNESMYIVEAKMKINKGQGNMILLRHNLPPDPGYSELYRHYYFISADTTPSNKISLNKLKLATYFPPPPFMGCFQLDEAPSSNLSHWIRMKSYVHLSKTYYPNPDEPSKYSQTNATFIKTYVYDYNTFADLSSVSALDTYGYSNYFTWTEREEPDNGPPFPFKPYINGYIGLGSGEDSNVLVDWIRVMKSPVVQPTVTVGSMESINYGWDSSTTNVKTLSTNNPNLLEPISPVLCDFNYYSSSGGPGVVTNFIIKNLPKGKYTITVTKGNYTNTSNVTTFTVIESGQSKSLATATIPTTGYGKFETKWVTINKENDNSDLIIGFSGKWLINSLIIDREAKGVKVGWK